MVEKANFLSLIIHHENDKVKGDNLKQKVCFLNFFECFIINVAQILAAISFRLLTRSSPYRVKSHPKPKTVAAKNFSQKSYPPQVVLCSHFLRRVAYSFCVKSF